MNTETPVIPKIVVRSSHGLGHAVRRMRKLRGMSQEQLARSAGVTQTTVSNVERAKTSPEVETIILILSALRLDIWIAPRPSAEPVGREGLGEIPR